MKVVKQQLKAFYRAKGLTGKRLKRAVWADERKALAYAGGRFFEQYVCGLSSQIVFAATDEGYAYWRARDKAK